PPSGSTMRVRRWTSAPPPAVPSSLPRKASSRLWKSLQVGSVTADAFSSDFHSLDDAFRVNDEGTAVGQALVFTQNFEVAADLHGRVADHGVLDLADGLGAVVPCFGGEVGVSGYGGEIGRASCRE